MSFARRLTASTVVAALSTVTAVAAIGLTSGVASAAATSPIDPPTASLSGATQGDITFYNASGTVITHGPLATPPAYAVAANYAATSADTLTTLFAVTPVEGQNYSAWPNASASVGAARPLAALPGALAGVTAPVAANIQYWFDAAGFPSAFPNTASAGSAYAGIYQLRVVTSGPGNPVNTNKFASATIAVDVTPGEWTQIYPTPAAPAQNTTTTITGTTPSVTADALTEVTVAIKVTGTASSPTGSVLVKADGTTVATAPLTSATSPDSLASVTIPANVLRIGAHSLTAEYTPSGSFNASATSSATSLAVTLPAPTVLLAPSGGAARVGVASACAPGTWLYAGAFNYAWYLDASLTPFSSSRTTVLLPAAYAGHKVTCKVTAVNPGNSATVAAAQITVAAGVAPRATVRPKIVGTVAVNRVVKAYLGVWSASPVPPTTSTYSYTWKVGSVIVSRASSYKPALKYKGKTLVLTVSAVRGGFLAGVATSPGVRIA